MEIDIFFPSLHAHKCSAPCWLGNTKSGDLSWNKKRISGPGLLQLHVSMYETVCFTFPSALCVLFVYFNCKYSRIDNLSLCTSAWHLPHSFLCLWMFFHNSNNSMIHENEVSLKGKYVVLGDHITCAHFCLPKEEPSWKGDCDCSWSSEFEMNAGENTRAMVRRRDCPGRGSFSIFLTPVVFLLMV